MFAFMTDANGMNRYHMAVIVSIYLPYPDSSDKKAIPDHENVFHGKIELKFY